MSMLIAEPRADRNGKVVTRHIKPTAAPAANLRLVPAPAIAANEVNEKVEIDDFNVMSYLGIRDINSGACERVESHIEDEYGATFEYDTEDDLVETITFPDSSEADRFNFDFHNGDLRSELRQIASDY